MLNIHSFKSEVRRKETLSKTFKTKLKITNKEQDQQLRRCAGAYRFFFNLNLDCQWTYTVYSKGISATRCVTANEMLRRLREDKKEHQKFFKGMNQSILDMAVFTSTKVYRRWFDTYSSASYRQPNYLSKKKDNMTFKVTSLYVYDSYIHLPKVGNFKLWEKNYIPSGLYRSVTFKHDGKDWWLILKTKKDEEKPSNENYKGHALLKIDSKGNIRLNGNLVENVVTSDPYKEVERKKKSLERKLKRQSLANIRDVGLAEKTVTSRNMVKIRAKIKALRCRLEAMRKDCFKKQANAIARTKLQTLHYFSSTTIKQKFEGCLSRSAREKHALDFYNMIVKRVANEGSEVLPLAIPSISKTP